MDAIVVGSGPNGLAAAITLAKAGRSVRVLEANDTIGGGCRSAELTLPGFVHDTCSAVHPMAPRSPFVRSLPESVWPVWVTPPAAVAHPLDDGTAVVVEQDLLRTAEGLGRDGTAYRGTVGRVARDWDALGADVLRPLLHWPAHPFLLAGFGLPALLSASVYARLAFREPRTRAMFAGVAAHSFLPLGTPTTTSFALMLLGAAHVGGWPFPRGGSQRISDALAGHLRSLGGEIETGHRVRDVAELPDATATLFDVTPRQLDRIAGARLPDGYRGRLRRYRPGPGVFKIDYALSAPVPWRAAECARAGTVHLGGSFEDVARAEAELGSGRHPERPFVLVAQHSLFDPTRAPVGKHTAWVYCHVPNGSTVDMTDRVEAQLERFAPGFRDVVLARHTMTTADVERRNENNIGGDISSGAHDGLQFLLRPFPQVDPYATPAKGIYLCSAATPPGAGVHGMCGANAARSALRRSFGLGVG